MIMRIGIPLSYSYAGVQHVHLWRNSAAANAGIPDRMFKRYCRWHSENAKDGYVKDSLKDCLLVSQNLSL